MSKYFEKEEARSFVFDLTLKEVLIKEKSRVWRQDSLSNGLNGNEPVCRGTTSPIQGSI